MSCWVYSLIKGNRTFWVFRAPEFYSSNGNNVVIVVIITITEIKKNSICNKNDDRNNGRKRSSNKKNGNHSSPSSLPSKPRDRCSMASFYKRARDNDIRMPSDPNLLGLGV